MDELRVIIVVANTITLLGAGAAAVLAVKAYLRTHSPALRSLALGFGFVTAGALLGGLLHQVAAAPLLQGIAIQSGFTAIGIAAIAYSLATEHRPTRFDQQSIL